MGMGTLAKGKRLLRDKDDRMLWRDMIVHVLTGHNVDKFFFLFSSVIQSLFTFAKSIERNSLGRNSNSTCRFKYFIILFLNDLFFFFLILCPPLFQLLLFFFHFFSCFFLIPLNLSLCFILSSSSFLLYILNFKIPCLTLSHMEIENITEKSFIKSQIKSKKYQSICTKIFKPNPQFDIFPINLNQNFILFIYKTIVSFIFIHLVLFCFFISFTEFCF